MWGYYGAKKAIVDYYPEPEFDLIIEPFAGTAQYSLKYWEHEVLLIEKYDVLVRIWKWLQECSKEDVLSLPRLKYGETTDDFSWPCEEAKWMMGFIIAASPLAPRKKITKWKAIYRPNTQNYKLSLIANSLEKIRHWDIRLGDFSESPNMEATWFIDPPYQVGGHAYIHGNKNLNYQELAKWCKSRPGQVIVCENGGGTWLDFKPLVPLKGSRDVKIEHIWTNR